MTRNLDAAVSTAIQAKNVRPVFLARIETDFVVETNSDEVLVWSGIGDLLFNGKTYQGLGSFGSISEIEEPMDLSARGIRLALSGIPLSMIATALGSVRQGQSITIWFATMDVSDNSLINNPYQIFAGETDTVEITEGAETATIAINAENRLIRLEKANSRRYTSEDQKTQVSGDLGFEYVPSLQDAEIVWGRG